MPPITLEDIRAAQTRIAPVAIRTPLVRLEHPSFTLYIKDESAQPIGSFKLRGAYSRIALLAEQDPAALARGVITYSSGNHAQGVAYAARALKAKAVIVMPDNAPDVKVKATRALGAEIVFTGPASTERKAKAEQLAAEHGYTIIPPYDDAAIIAGQATCGLEILEQLGITQENAADLLVLSPVSGGGLLSGVSTAIKRLAPKARIYGVEPALAADAAASFRTRTLTEWPASSTTRTIADGLRTQSLGKLNFEHILAYTDDILNVTEDEIFDAMRYYLTHSTLIPEPSGAVTLAAVLYHPHELPPAKTVVAILSGGNIDPTLYAQLQNKS